MVSLFRMWWESKDCRRKGEGGWESWGEKGTIHGSVRGRNWEEEQKGREEERKYEKIKR